MRFVRNLEPLFKPLRDMPIRNKLILAFLVLALIPVTLIAYFSFNKSRELIEYKTGQYTTDILNESSKNIEFHLRETDRLTYMLLSNNEVQDALRESNKGFPDEYRKVVVAKKMNKILLESILGRGDIESIGIFSKTGVEYSVSLIQEPLEFDEQNTEEINKALGSTVWLSTNPERGTIPSARVVNDLTRQNRIGYLVLNFREKELFDIYKNVVFYKTGEMYIIDRQGRMVSHEDKKLLNQKLSYPYLGDVLGSSPNGFFTFLLEGKNHYITYHAIANTGWKIVSVIPAVEYEKEVISLKNWTILIAVSCWLFAVMVSFFLSASISKPIRMLSAMMRKVGKGDFKVFSSYDAKDEVGMLSGHFNKMVEQIDMLIQKVYHEQLVKQRAELKSLRMQINPHFLYNTLESINWMARIKGAPEVGKMAKALGDLMRTSIAGDDFISLENEMKSIGNYLTIQKFRYGDKFQVETRIHEDILQAKVPKLILQPLVENAIVHGIETKLGSGKIEIEGVRDGDRILVKVCDDGVGIERERIKTILAGEEAVDEKHTKIGLINVDRRIKIYYGEEYGIDLQSEQGSGTTVIVSLPYTTEDTI